MIDLVDPVSTTNGYGPCFPMHTPTVTSTPPSVAVPLGVALVLRPLTAVELLRVEILTGMVATAG
jgi:hypothetical protein